MLSDDAVRRRCPTTLYDDAVRRRWTTTLYGVYR
jgi:hypothetical protein